MKYKSCLRWSIRPRPAPSLVSNIQLLTTTLYSMLSSLPTELLLQIGNYFDRARVIYRLMVCSRRLFHTLSPLLSCRFDPDMVNQYRKRFLRMRRSLGSQNPTVIELRKYIINNRLSLGPDDTRGRPTENPRLSYAIWINSGRFPEYRGCQTYIPSGFRPKIESEECICARMEWLRRTDDPLYTF